MPRLKGGIVEQYETERGYLRRVWLPEKGLKNKTAGIPLSVDFEEFADTHHIPDGWRVQKILWNKGFVTAEDFHKPGIHQTLVHALQAVKFAKGDKRKAVELADVIVREIRSNT